MSDNQKQTQTDFNTLSNLFKEYQNSSTKNYSRLSSVSYSNEDVNNFREDFNNEPLPIKRSLYDLMIVAVQNDTLILSMIEIVDYSLLIRIIYDENEKIRFNEKKID